MSQENLSLGVYDQVRLKPACSATEARSGLEISALASWGIILSGQRITKALIRLRGCAGWSGPLLFAYGKNRFFQDVAHINKICFKARYIDTGVIHLPYGPRQANLVLIAYASSEGSGEPAHPRSLARTSAARSYKQWVKRNLQTESQFPGPSEWLGMRS